MGNRVYTGRDYNKGLCQDSGMENDCGCGLNPFNLCGSILLNHPGYTYYVC